MTIARISCVARSSSRSSANTRAHGSVARNWPRSWTIFRAAYGRADLLERARLKDAVPDLARIVVAVDASGARDSEDAAADFIGIVVAAKGVDGRFYVLADRSCKLSPAGWGRRAGQAYQEFRADRLVYDATSVAR